MSSCLKLPSPLFHQIWFLVVFSRTKQGKVLSVPWFMDVVLWTLMRSPLLHLQYHWGPALKPLKTFSPAPKLAGLRRRIFLNTTVLMEMLIYPSSDIRNCLMVLQTPLIKDAVCGGGWPLWRQKRERNMWTEGSEGSFGESWRGKRCHIKQINMKLQLAAG